MILLTPRPVRSAGNLAKVLQIDTARRLQPEIITARTLPLPLVLFATFQAAHREVFNRAAAHVFQQGNRRFHRHNAVRRLLLSGPVEILTTGVPVGETRPLTTVSFCPSSARLVATPVKTWLTCCGCTAGDLAHHRRLVRIAAPSPTESALSISFAYSRISATALATSG
jgi:hypothetical protein